MYPQITHGGSMRYVVARKNSKNISPKIKNLIKEETSMKMDNINAYIKFKKDCEISKESFTKLEPKVFKQND